MARVVGSFNKDTNYEVSIRKPIDARIVVPSYADLTTESNWLNEAGKSIVYNGLIVAVVDTTDIEHSGVYYFYDVSFSALKGGTVTNIDNWIKLCTLDELNSLKTRVETLEGLNGVTQEQLTTAIEALRTEIAEAGYLTADSLNGYATETFVRDEISKLSIPEDTSSRVSDLESGLASLTSTVAGHSTDIKNITHKVDLQDTTIANLQSSISTNESNIGAVESKVSDLEGVVDNKANKVDVEAQVALLATKEVVDAKADTEYVNTELAKKADTEALADKADVSAVTTLETKVDETVTRIDTDLATRATTDYVNTQLAGKVDNATLANYATTQIVEDLETQIGNANSKLQDVYTKEEVDNAIANAQLEGEEVDLSDYAKKSDIPDVSGFITEVPSEYITEEELSAKGYALASDIPSTDGFIKMDDVTALGYITAVPDEYITEDELSAKGFITEHQDISGLATKAELNAYATDDDVAAKADKATTLSGYGITDAYTRTEIDDKFTEFAGGGSINLDGYVSEDEWNERVALLATNDALGLTQAEVDAVEKNLNDNYSTTEQVKAMVNDHIVTTIAYGEF